MLAASELKTGTVIKLDNELFSATSVDYHEGSGQFATMVFVKLRGLTTHHVKELRLHPNDKFEDVVLERQEMEYLYKDDTGFWFMNPDTFEQIGLPREAIGDYEKFLQPNMRIPVELYEGSPVNIVFPEAVELTVVSAPPGLREHETSTYKPVILENGMEVLAPQFIKDGDMIKVETATAKYLERVRHGAR